ncbi:MAG: helix-turn-helix transcriptional regulator, partial [Candidatus Izemoplasmatales bacterium]|nr:helix-turn-helix transcriptional regulator [Candidatus Izemoplasmatales bacterium]
MLNIDLISKKITAKRKQKGMTQEELADALFVSRQAVSKWEMGKSLPSIDSLVEMTKLFDVTIDYILDGSEINDHDYQSMFMQYPRESVIYHFLNSNHINDDIKNIFYLLTT